MNAEILLPASKSLSNRVLIIRALANIDQPIVNLSEAKDTQDLLRCLQSNRSEIEVGEGATTLRFLLAYFAITQKKIILHCSDSLKQRPIKELLEILERLGCQFHYIEKEYQLPLQITSGIHNNYSDTLIIDTSKSSQFASAILLIAPYLSKGLEIKFTNTKVSESYLQMTEKLMIEFGAILQKKHDSILVKASSYVYHEYTVETDWSAACFFYAFLGIFDSGKFYFPNLKISGMQGDEIIKDFFLQFGVETEAELNGVSITKIITTRPEMVSFDFTNHPDLFPAFAIFCAITKTNAHFDGLQNLKYKESNRLKIISDFLLKQNVDIIQHKAENGNVSADFIMKYFNDNIPLNYPSYNDHRIAMSFSLLNTIHKITIENPAVVQKSFPGFWDEIKKFL